jgi:hypothetical protein
LDKHSNKSDQDTVTEVAELQVGVRTLNEEPQEDITIDASYDKDELESPAEEEKNERQAEVEETIVCVTDMNDDVTTIFSDNITREEMEIQKLREENLILKGYKAQYDKAVKDSNKKRSIEESAKNTETITNFVSDREKKNKKAKKQSRSMNLSAHKEKKVEWEITADHKKPSDEVQEDDDNVVANGE